MKLSWLIELIEMNTAPAGYYDPAQPSGTRRWPQCILMGRVAHQDTNRALMEYYNLMAPEKRDPDELRPPYRISGVPIYLDNGLPELGIRVLRNDGSSYQVVGTYRP